MGNKEYLSAAEKDIREEWKSADGDNKIIYLKHNFVRNFRSASGDATMKNDMILSEIAKLIHNRKSDLVNIYNKDFPAAPISATASNHKLVHLVSRGLKSSMAFASDIAAEIVGYQSGMSADQKNKIAAQIMSRLGKKKSANAYAADDSTSDSTDSGSSPSVLDYVDSVANLVASLGSLFGGKASTPAAGNTANAKATNALGAKTAGVAGTAATSNVGLYISIAVGVAVLVTVAVVVFRK